MCNIQLLKCFNLEPDLLCIGIFKVRYSIAGREYEYSFVPYYNRWRCNGIWINPGDLGESLISFPGMPSFLCSLLGVVKDQLREEGIVYSRKEQNNKMPDLLITT